MNRRRLSRVGAWAAVWVAAATALGAARPQVRPTRPAAMAVRISGGTLRTSRGAAIDVKPAVLRLDPPVMRDGEAHGKTPINHAASFDDFEPWPSRPEHEGGPPRTLDLSPRYDEDHTLVLGGLFRAIVPESVEVTDASGRAAVMGRDYDYNAEWGQVANRDGGLGEPGAGTIKATFRYATQRLDLIEVDAAGNVKVKRGEPRMTAPWPPSPDEGWAALAGVYIAPWRRDGAYTVTADDINMVDPAAPVQPINPDAVSRTLGKLRAGKPVTIAFMGDSVTLGAESGPWWADLWTAKNRSYTSRVIVALRQRFPGATITPVAAVQGGTSSAVAAGMYDKAVQPAHPDVLFIAFGLNDAAGPIGKPPSNPVSVYRQQLAWVIERARADDAEVVLVTPMQPNPWLANGIARRIVDYRKALISLAEQERVALADVYTAWMNQATHGIPPWSQLHNWINHPSLHGHALYARTIMRLFPVRSGDAVKFEVHTTPRVSRILQETIQ